MRRAGILAVVFTVAGAFWLSMAVTQHHDTAQFAAAGVFSLLAAVLLTWEEHS